MTHHEFPGRAWFEWLLMLPLAIPTYLAAYCFTELLDFTGPVQALVRTITGGVAANRELRARAAASASAFGLELSVPAFASCTDNAAMIAYAGAQRFLAGEQDALDLAATSTTILPRQTLRGAGPR